MRTSLPALLAVAALGAVPAAAQSVISARSGMIHYTEGRVLLDDQRVERKFGQFPEIKQNEVLRTQRGRAEVLLTPGVFLRMRENSSVRMVSNRLADTRLELLSGSILVECAELLDGNAVSVEHKGAVIDLRKQGLYRLEADPATLKVYQGQAEVSRSGHSLRVKKGRILDLNGEPEPEKFDTKTGDAFYRWSARRASYLALANISAAKSLRESGGAWRSSAWRWNPYFGMVTFIPGRGIYNSPFGYSFWSPSRVYTVYAPRREQPVYSSFGGRGGYNPNLGYTTVPQRSYGGISTGASSGAPAANSAPAASPRTSDDASPRGGDGGGRGR